MFKVTLAQVKEGLTIATVVAGVIGGTVAIAWPRFIGDYPPIANQDRVEQAIMSIRATINQSAADSRSNVLRGDIFSAWRACRAALREGKIAQAEDAAQQIFTLQNEYQMLNEGMTVSVTNCP